MLGANILTPQRFAQPVHAPSWDFARHVCCRKLYNARLAVRPVAEQSIPANAMTSTANASWSKIFDRHAGTTAPVQYNVGLSCNHPLFVLWYVKEAVPDLLVLQTNEWFEPHQPAVLKAYLLHHQQLLTESGLWNEAAVDFVQQH